MILSALSVYATATEISSQDLLKQDYQKDINYYQKTSKLRNLDANSKLYILYNLQKKYDGKDIDITLVKNEINTLEPQRTRKAPPVITDPLQEDLSYYYKVSNQVKLKVNDMLYILYKIRDKYEGKGIDLTPIDEELTKLNPQWMEGRPVAYKKESARDEKDTGDGIKPGDILGISVYPMEKFPGEALVRENGTVSLPLIDNLNVKNMSLEQFASEVQTRLVRYVTNPLVTVVRHKTNKNQIFISGEVRFPGSYFYSADISIPGLISLAGGLTRDADEAGIRLYREKTVIKVESKDFPLKAYDIVEIPGMTKKISVLGEIESPGDYNFFEGMTVKDAVNNAKGAKKSAKINSVKIYRKTPTADRSVFEENLEKVLNGKTELDLKLEPGDIIFVQKK